MQQKQYGSADRQRWTAFAVVCALMFAALLGAAGPAAAQSSRQKDKNLMRNLGIGLGAAAVWQATKGKTTNAAILGAGAALAGKKYEDARKAQTRENDWRNSGDWRRDGGRFDTYRPERPTYERYRRDDDDRRRYVGSSNHPGKHKGWSKGKGNKKKGGRDCD